MLSQTIISLFVVVIYQTWIHTEKIGKLGIPRQDIQHPIRSPGTPRFK